MHEEKDPIPPDAERPDHVPWTPTLVARLRAGDADAGELLTNLYRQALIRFCWGYLPNLPDAEDAVQDVFLKVLKATVVPDSFRAWLYRIARNHCLNQLRTRSRKGNDATLPPGSELDAMLTGPLSRMVRGELRSQVAHLMAALPSAHREILRLRYAEGLSRAEIADVVQIPESVVKSRLYEAVKKLREHTALLDSE